MAVSLCTYTLVRFKMNLSHSGPCAENNCVVKGAYQTLQPSTGYCWPRRYEYLYDSHATLVTCLISVRVCSSARYVSLFPMFLQLCLIVLLYVGNISPKRHLLASQHLLMAVLSVIASFVYLSWNRPLPILHSFPYSYPYHPLLQGLFKSVERGSLLTEETGYEWTCNNNAGSSI